MTFASVHWNLRAWMSQGRNFLSCATVDDSFRIPAKGYQLRVVVGVYLVILLGFYTSQVVSRISEPSAVRFAIFFEVTQPFSQMIIVASCTATNFHLYFCSQENQSEMLKFDRCFSFHCWVSEVFLKLFWYTYNSPREFFCWENFCKLNNEERGR